MDDGVWQSEGRPAAAIWLRCLAGAWLVWAAWWLMMASHEFGHVATVLITGGSIDHVDLSPLGFSQTHLSANPQPLLVVWAGPVFGALDALAAWLVVRWLGRQGGAWRKEAVVTFVAGFCLLANGVYIGLGWVDRVGDTGDMLRHGTPAWVMAVFGGVSSVAGLALWHTLGPRLWLKRVSDADAWRLVFASAAVVALGFVVAVVVG